jgi:hypothetical protein
VTPSKLVRDEANAKAVSELPTLEAVLLLAIASAFDAEIVDGALKQNLRLGEYVIEPPSGGKS